MSLSAAYAAAASLAGPALRLSLRRRVRRGKEVAERLGERRGIDATPRPAGRLLWLHAASVGEATSVLPVLSALSQDVSVLMTTGTVTSARLLDARLPELGLAGRVTHRFVPLDVPRWAARFLDHWRPDAAAFVESELWPNLLAGCQARGVPAALVNARMSPRSFSHWRRAPRMAARMLGGLAEVRARSTADAERFSALGARNVTAPGDLKFAAPKLPASPETLAALRAATAGRAAWLAASTHPGEEEVVLEAHRRLLPAHRSLLTIIAPRHPERGPGIAPDAPHRSAGRGPDAPVWVADTLGELGLLYRLAPIVLVGRSLIRPGGGQNMLEPARLGCAVACGPFTENFDDAAEALNGALTRVADAEELAGWVDAMLRDPVRRAILGEEAQAAADRFSGLPAETARALERLIG